MTSSAFLCRENPGLTSISERQLCQGGVAWASSLIFHWVFWIYNPVSGQGFCWESSGESYKALLFLLLLSNSSGFQWCGEVQWAWVSVFLLSLEVFSEHFFKQSSASVALLLLELLCVYRLIHLAGPLNRHSFSPDLSPSLLALPSARKSLLLKVLVHFLVQSYSLATEFQFAYDFCPSVKWLTLFLPCFLCRLFVNSCSLFTQLP